MDDRNFDEKTAQVWINTVEKSGRSWRDDFVYSKLNNLITNAKLKTILDIGCGQGICSDKIELKQCKYTGVEPSPFLLNRAIQLYSSETKIFLSGNAYKLPLLSRSFDGAFSILVWHLLMDLERAASELSRILVDGGHFMIVTANPDAYPEWKAFYSDLKLTGKKLEGTMNLGDSLSHDILYLHTLNEFQDSLQKVGLKIEQTEFFLPSKESPEMNLLISIQGKKYR